MTTDSPTLATITRSILSIRGQRVILDSELAKLYGVDTRSLNQAVNRNIDRFPIDFMFQLSVDEHHALRSQIVTSNKRGGRRYAPYAFTEHGAIMAATILNSPRAVAVSVAVVRAFVRLREILASDANLKAKLEALEKKYDAQFKVVFDAIRQLMTIPAEAPKPKIGYQTEEQLRKAKREHKSGIN